MRGVTKQTSIPSSAPDGEWRMPLRLFFLNPLRRHSNGMRLRERAALWQCFNSRLLLDPLLHEQALLCWPGQDARKTAAKTTAVSAGLLVSGYKDYVYSFQEASLDFHA